MLIGISAVFSSASFADINEASSSVAQLSLGRESFFTLIFHRSYNHRRQRKMQERKAPALKLSSFQLLNELHVPMVVAVAIMWMVQVAVHEIVDVIAMRDRGMTAVRAVHMPLVMAVAGMTVRTIHWVCGVNIQRVLIDMAIMRMVQMAIVKEVDVIIMLNGGMTAG